jgi:hypothetical protein
MRGTAVISQVTLKKSGAPRQSHASLSAFMLRLSLLRLSHRLRLSSALTLTLTLNISALHRQRRQWLPSQPPKSLLLRRCPSMQAHGSEKQNGTACQCDPDRLDPHSVPSLARCTRAAPGWHVPGAVLWSNLGAGTALTTLQHSGPYYGSHTPIVPLACAATARCSLCSSRGVRTAAPSSPPAPARCTRRSSAVPRPLRSQRC